jgi:hypothetical protein
MSGFLRFLSSQSYTARIFETLFFTLSSSHNYKHFYEMKQNNALCGYHISVLMPVTSISLWDFHENRYRALQKLWGTFEFRRYQLHDTHSLLRCANEFLLYFPQFMTSLGEIKYTALNNAIEQLQILWKLAQEN